MTNVDSNKLLPKFIRPFHVVRRFVKHIRLSCHVEYARILRPTSDASGCITTLELLPVKKALALKHPHQILVLAVLTLSLRLKLVYLTQIREIY